jgi:hypothetical protein
MGSESDRQSVRLDISFELQPTPAFALLNWYAFLQLLLCRYSSPALFSFQGVILTQGESCFQCSIVLNMHWWWDGLDRFGSWWVSFHLSHYWRFCWSSPCWSKPWSSLLPGDWIFLVPRWQQILAREMSFHLGVCTSRKMIWILTMHQVDWLTYMSDAICKSFWRRKSECLSFHWAMAKLHILLLDSFNTSSILDGLLPARYMQCLASMYCFWVQNICLCNIVQKGIAAFERLLCFILWDVYLSHHFCLFRVSGACLWTFCTFLGTTL